MMMFSLASVRGSKSAEGGPNPLADLVGGGPISVSGFGPGGSLSVSGFGLGGPNLGGLQIR